MTNLAYAMGGMGQGGAEAGGANMGSIVVMIAIFAIFYFLLIRPQQKKQKAVTEMIKNLNHGDMVVTAGGLHGKITGLTDNIVTLEITDKVRVKVSRNHVSAIIEKSAKE